MRLDKVDFLLVQPVFAVKLQVDVMDGLRPVDIGMIGEVLQRGCCTYQQRVAAPFSLQKNVAKDLKILGNRRKI